MQTGMLATEGRDGIYVGLKNEGSDLDLPAIINWSSNAGSIDPLRMIFTCNPLGSGIAATDDGLEIVRVRPNNNGNEGYFGLGDFNTAVDDPTERLDVLNGNVRIRDLPGTNSTSLEFVTVDANGILEARTLPAVPVDCEWTMNATAPNHVYTAFNTTPDGACPNNNEAVAVGLSLASGTPPAKFTTQTREFATAVQVTNQFSTTDVRGINVDVTSATANNYGLEVTVNNPGSSISANFGAQLELSGPVVRTRGVQAITNGGTFRCYAGDFVSNDVTTGVGSETFGVNGLVTAGSYATGSLLSAGANGNAQSRAQYNMGVRGISYAANNTVNGTNHYGVWGFAQAQPPVMNGDDCPQNFQYNQFAAGIYGTARTYRCETDPNFVTNHWAGYFEGDVNVTGEGFIPNIWQTSDAQFKTNVESIANASDLLQQLQPKTYDYIPQDHPHLNLVGTGQFGLLAQDLQSVIPTLVKSKFVPAVFDSTGNVTDGELTHLVVNYTGLIPILIAGHKEQQAVVDQQAAQLAEQQAQIEALTDQAAANQATSDELEELRNRMDQLEQLLAACCQNPADPRNQMDAPTDGIEENERILRIQPNPFTEQTTIYYQLERSGRMQLMANSSDGKQLRVLEEAHREAAAYQYEWITNDLAPGIYYVTLLLDGEPVVKKAVKVR